MCKNDLVRQEALANGVPVGVHGVSHFSEDLGVIQEDCMFSSSVTNT